MAPGLIRREDWAARLAAFLAAARTRPFAWGEWDCALFALAGVESLTGAVLADWWSGDARAASEALRARGGLAAIVDELLPRREVVAAARRGDVALFDGPHGDTLAVVEGRYLASPGVDGLLLTPFESARVAWRVG